MATVQIQKDAGIKNVKNLYNEIKDIIPGENELVMDFSDVERVDLSVIQLIMSAQQYARQNECMIKLKNVPEQVREQLYIGGLIK